MSLRFFRKFRVYSRNSADLLQFRQRRPAFIIKFSLHALCLPHIETIPLPSISPIVIRVRYQTARAYFPPLKRRMKSSVWRIDTLTFPPSVLLDVPCQQRKKEQTWKRLVTKVSSLIAFNFWGEWRNNELKSELCKRSDWRSTKLIFLDCRIN